MAECMPTLHEMVAVNDAYKRGRYENDWLNSFRLLSSVKVFTTQDGRTANQTDENVSLHIKVVECRKREKTVSSVGIDIKTPEFTL